MYPTPWFSSILGVWSLCGMSEDAGDTEMSWRLVPTALAGAQAWSRDSGSQKRSPASSASSATHHTGDVTLILQL